MKAIKNKNEHKRPLKIIETLVLFLPYYQIQTFRSRRTSFKRRRWLGGLVC
jgi:hypothetical protein